MFEPGGALRSASKPFLSQYTLKQLGVCHCAGAGVGNIAETIQGANHFTGWCSLMCVSRSSGRPQERSLRDVFWVRRCDLESVLNREGWNVQVLADLPGLESTGVACQVNGLTSLTPLERSECYCA